MEAHHATAGSPTGNEVGDQRRRDGVASRATDIVGELPDLWRAPRPTAVRIMLDSRRSPLRRGDVLFGNRLSMVQAFMNASADPVTHSAIVGVVAGELRTIEVGPNGCFSRPVDAFTSAYRYVGLGRLSMSAHCIGLVASEAERQLEAGELTYSWSACALIESVALARRFCPAVAEPRIIAAAQRAAGRLSEQLLPTAVTCSGFVAGCLGQACHSCWPTLGWPLRQRVAPWRAAPTVTDLRSAGRRSADSAVANLLVTPSDLWVCAPYEFRSVIRPDLTTVLVDLTTPRSTPCLFDSADVSFAEPGGR